MRTKRALVVALLAAASLIGPTSLVAAAPQAKEVIVKRLTFTFVDDSRATPPNGDYAGAPDRTLETVVSLPKGANKKHPLPVVVFATGIGGTATNYADMYDHWVKAGYMVVAPTFPLSSEDAPGGTSAVDLSEQPADLSFILDEVLALNADKKSKLFGLVDEDRIGLAGKSLGAITVLDLIFKAEHHDDRFKALVVLTGISGGASDFDAFQIPILFVHGDADETVPIRGSQEAYDNAQAPKFFVTIAGASHSSAFHGEDDDASVAVVRTVVDFLDAFLKGKKSGLTRLGEDGNVDGVASLQATP